MKTREREIARKLRAEEGASIKEIARRIGAAPSSISRWVGDVPLSDEQREALLERASAGLIRGRTMNAEIRREARRRAQAEGRSLARRLEPLHIAGCMLYWAEGAKSRAHLKFVNSDPQMARLFVTFLRSYFDLADERIKITCYLFADHVQRQREIEHFWLDALGLPDASLRTSVVNVYSKYSKKTRTNKLPFGTCHISVDRVSVTQHIYGAIQEYGGFARPEWLE